MSPEQGATHAPRTEIRLGARHGGTPPNAAICQLPDGGHRDDLTTPHARFLAAHDRGPTAPRPSPSPPGGSTLTPRRPAPQPAAMRKQGGQPVTRESDERSVLTVHGPHR